MQPWLGRHPDSWEKSTGSCLKQPAGCWFRVFNDFWCFDWCNPRKTPDKEKVWPSKVAYRSPSKPWERSAALVQTPATRPDEAAGFGCGDLFFPKFPVITCIKTLQSHLIAFCGSDDMKLVSLLIFSKVGPKHQLIICSNHQVAEDATAGPVPGEFTRAGSFCPSHAGAWQLAGRALPPWDGSIDTFFWCHFGKFFINCSWPFPLEAAGNYSCPEETRESQAGFLSPFSGCSLL